jgi:hypothetical protein
MVSHDQLVYADDDDADVRHPYNLVVGDAVRSDDEHAGSHGGSSLWMLTLSGSAEP